MRFISLLASLGLILAPAAVAAKSNPAVVLIKSGDWELEHDKSACHLKLTAGPPDNPLRVQFSRFQPADSFRLTLSGKRLMKASRWSEATMAFTAGKPGKAEIWTSMVDGIPTSVSTLQRLDGLPGLANGRPTLGVTTAQEAQTRWLDIAIPRTESLRIEFGSLAKPFEALRSCTNNLVRSWGYDPQEISEQTRPAEPIGNPGTWANLNDYPEQIIARRPEGLTTIRLDIDQSGQIAGCTVLASSGHNLLDQRTCELLRARARFSPALNHEGLADKSFWISTVRWRLPNI